MKRSLKWIIPIAIVLAMLIYVCTSTGMGKITTDLTQAYAEPELYRNALEKANSDEEVIEVIGEIKPINKMTILNGEVKYSDNNRTVNSTIKISGEKGKGKMDITAIRKNEDWQYEKINIRIEDPEKNKRTTGLRCRRSASGVQSDGRKAAPEDQSGKRNTCGRGVYSGEKLFQGTERVKN